LLRPSLRSLAGNAILKSSGKPLDDDRVPTIEGLVMSDEPQRANSPDTNTNRVFRTASFFCAGLQVFLMLMIAISHLQPVVGRNPLEQLTGFVEVLTMIPVLLLLQVIGSAFGLGAGSFKIPCIVSNIVCCSFFAFCGLAFIDLMTWQVTFATA
jgi:hypothetical protein